MIKFQATAVIHSISPVIQVSENFQKRELILNDSWTKDGQVYNNYILIEFAGDRMAQLDNYFPGQRVSVDVYVNGREHNGKYFTSLRGQVVVLAQSQQQAQSQQPMSYQQPMQYQQQGYQPTPAPPAYPQQMAPPAYAQPQQQPQYAPPQPQQPYGGQPTSPGVNDLPFGRR